MDDTFCLGGTAMGAKILIVEDDPQIAFIVKEMLEEKGYEVTWATTGLEGHEDFKLGKFDLVLIDLMLPEMDGFTLCKHIRLTSDVPILIISAKQDDVDKVKSLGLGADDYIEKPFSLVELEARIQSHLRRWYRFNGQTQTSSTTLTFNDGLKIDTKSQKVFIDDEHIYLTAKEFELLDLLASQPNTVFTKELLFQQIWEQSFEGGMHTVTVHVKALREKLRDSAKNPRWIATVWGRGYEFIGVPNEN